MQVGVKRKLSSHLSACLSAGIDSIPFKKLWLRLWVVLTRTQSLQSVPLVKPSNKELLLLTLLTVPGTSSCRHFPLACMAMPCSLWLHRHSTLSRSLDGLHGLTHLSVSLCMYFSVCVLFSIFVKLCFVLRHIKSYRIVSPHYVNSRSRSRARWR